VGAMKYPAFLLSAGILGCVLWRALRSSAESIEKRVFQLLGAGILTGILVFGLADWIAYGRPWESLWMYAQYNIFPRLWSRQFGAQPFWTFFHFFSYRWTWALLPFGLLIAPLAWIGWIFGIRRSEPAAWASGLYLLGHLLVAHKEERFMIPLSTL